MIFSYIVSCIFFCIYPHSIAFSCSTSLLLMTPFLSPNSPFILLYPFDVLFKVYISVYERKHVKFVSLSLTYFT